jgi:uncharacterized protein YqhQ
MSEKIGGQAVIEGVMMKTPKRMAVAVRSKGKIKKKRFRLRKRGVLAKVPFVRGVAELYDILVLGIKALLWSADVAAGDEGEKLSAWEIALTFIFAFSAVIVIFIAIPLFLTKLLVRDSSFAFALIDGVFRLAVFLVYLWAIGLMKDIRRLFQYHGAEHKAVYCIEHGASLTPKNAKKFSPLHPRCGTSFLMIVIAISIIIFAFIADTRWWVKLLWRIALIPVVAGFSYEILKISAKYRNNIIMKAIVNPGLWVQRLTTREPTEKQIEVAIAALKEAR